MSIILNMNKIESFKKYLLFEKRYSEHTVRSYINDLSQFETFLIAQLSITEDIDVRHVHVRSWMVHLMQDAYVSKSINRKISTLKSYFKYLKKIGDIEMNPMSKVITPKMPKRLPKVIREDSLQILFSEINEDESFSNVRNRLIVDMLYSTGMRRSELINIIDSDINLSLKQIKVLGKGNKERLIPISDGLIKIIKDYQSLRDDEIKREENYLLVTDKGTKLYPKLVYNVVRTMLSKYSTSEHKSPHVLRHSFATHMANKGAELNSIKEILGHANLSATEIYMHNSIERLKTVYKGAHPKSH